MMLRLAVALVRLWTRAFTLGMPPTAREWRRAEIESDLWEQHDDRTASPWQLLGRLFRGIPADVLWRIDEESMRSRTLVVVGASVGIILAAGAIWLYDTMRADTLPTPPPAWVRVGAPAGSVPPPPPPPPPPPDQSSSLRRPIE
jgi:hypothetical protein